MSHRPLVPDLPLAQHEPRRAGLFNSALDAEVMVGTARFELATPCTPSKCATRLRYVPSEKVTSDRVQVIGVKRQPPTSTLPSAPQIPQTGEAAAAQASSKSWARTEWRPEPESESHLAWQAPHMMTFVVSSRVAGAQGCPSECSCSLSLSFSTSARVLLICSPVRA